jgi:alanyl-tRNA synthetase
LIPSRLATEDGENVMKPLSSDAVRRTFLDYFAAAAHQRIGGASVLAKGDPTLLFVNSGMAPLKPYFTGEQQPPARDLTNIQPCIRTIDIGDVGDRHHLTFFEMLGSWSIGGYFKQRAVELAFGLLTEGYGFTPEQLYVTIFEGDPALGVGADEESAAAWESVGMARDHIVPQPTADNFWGPAGDTGPCGPSTEVFLDTGDGYGPAWRPGGEFDTKSRYIEIWNAGVFMQFFQDAGGGLSPLPFSSVDTGSGLERVTMALNGLDNVYETDLLRPVARAAQDLFGDTGEIQRRHRLITDHLRASCMIMAEGVRPGNEGAGYIPRRLLRRCLTEAVQGGLEDVSFAPVVDAVISGLGEYYPLLTQRRDDLQRTVAAECREFGAVIRRGLGRLEDVLPEAGGSLSGQEVFQLFATYGLPAEITQSLAAERGVGIDLDGYQAEFRRHQDLSRGEPGRAGDAAVSLAGLPATEFTGYSALTGTGVVLALLADGERVQRVAAGQQAELVTDTTPFYAEGGGQIGDRGTAAGDGVTLQVTGTRKQAGQYLHEVRVTQGEVAVGDVLELAVDGERRAATAANHSATHLLNAALREVLGEHVTQAGSVVEPERLRFDFTHPAPMTPAELQAVERLVNSWVLADHDRSTDELPQAEAKASGAVFLGGEDYGDLVRVVAFDGVSKELCGGTHVPHTSFIGSFRIRSEQSIASGVRRINAVTRFGALDAAESDREALSTVATTLHTSPRDVVTAAQRLARAASERPGRPAPPEAAELTEVVELTSGAGVPTLVARVTAEPKLARATAIQHSRQQHRVVMLWTESGERSHIVIAVPADIAVSAQAAVKAVLAGVAGSGGGSDAVAQGAGASFAGGPAPAELLARFLG